jgi:hypothetical protein
MDLQLDGLSIQNVIGGLVLRRAPDRPERRGYLALDPLPQDIEIELEPSQCPLPLSRVNRRSGRLKNCVWLISPFSGLIEMAGIEA